MYHFSTALQTYLKALLGTRKARFTSARENGDLGASAVELAIITAMILVIALGLLYAIQHFVTAESGKIHG
jgi:hypothetical protein